MSKISPTFVKSPNIVIWQLILEIQLSHCASHKRMAASRARVHRLQLVPKVFLIWQHLPQGSLHLWTVPNNLVLL